MSLRHHTASRAFPWIAAVLFCLVIGRSIEGHATLRESSPAANSSVMGPDVPVTLRFNARIDAPRSKLQLLRPDNTTTDLAIEKQTSPDTLTARATGLKSGAYRIQWQVLASDGHITRGIIPFRVTGHS
jgi:methionine-rich copper-binding protein CopC